MEEGSKVGLRDKNGALVMAFMLGLFEADSTTEKWNIKRDIIHFNGTWYLKIILILLTKIVEVYVKFL